jgi:hypothetical protein
VWGTTINNIVLKNAHIPIICFDTINTYDLGVNCKKMTAATEPSLIVGASEYTTSHASASVRRVTFNAGYDVYKDDRILTEHD